MRNKEIIVSIVGFLLFYVVVSQGISWLFPHQINVVLIGWLSILVQGSAVFLLYQRKLNRAAIVGIVAIILQLLIQLV